MQTTIKWDYFATAAQILISEGGTEEDGDAWYMPQAPELLSITSRANSVDNKAASFYDVTSTYNLILPRQQDVTRGLRMQLGEDGEETGAQKQTLPYTRVQKLTFDWGIIRNNVPCLSLPLTSWGHL